METALGTADVADAPASVTVGIPTYNRASWLREAMTSVLAQTYRDFRLLVCDNASDDETPDVVASFVDPRIQYARSERNVGMIGNFNRAIELTETEYLVILPDDDLLYPEYLSSVVRLIDLHSNVGVVHTGCDLIDAEGRVFLRDWSPWGIRRAPVIQSGEDCLEHYMRSNWPLCFSSALFRTRALVETGGFRADEEPLADPPVFMRIALGWDFAYVPRSLVSFRLHAAAATVELGSFAGTGYILPQLPEIFFERRTRFLEEARLPPERARHYRSIAERTFREDRVRRLASEAGAGTPWLAANAAFVELVRTDSRILFLPETWRFVAAQLGGRHAKRLAQRAESLRGNGVKSGAGRSAEDDHR